MSLSFELPIPARELSPNARARSMFAMINRTRCVREARRLAQREALRVLDGQPPPWWKKARLDSELHHLTPRVPDPSNFIASLKAYIDGLADAGIVVNDRDLWPERPTYIRCNRLPHVRLIVTPEAITE